VKRRARRILRGELAITVAMNAASVLFWLAVLVVFKSFAPSPVYAITAPDNLLVVSAQCFGGLLEVGDIGCLTHYDIDYASVPTELASDTYLNSLISSSTTDIIRSSNPYVFVNSGYGNGVVNIYFADVDAGALGVTWNAAHPMRLAGNPSVFPSVPQINGAITWVAQTNGGASFGNAVLALGADLEVEAEWAGVDLVETSGTGTVLTAQGEDYFVNAIPNLRSIAPDIFSSAILTPQFTEREFTAPYADALETQFDDTALSSTFDGLTAFSGAPEVMVRSSVAFVLILAVWAMTTAYMQRTPNGQVIAIMPVPVLIAGCTLLGWIPLQAAGLIGFIMLFVIAIYFVRR